MNIYSNITQTAQLIGDATRMSILMDLSGMHALTASELAKSANVSPQTASSHLKKLIEGNLIIVRRQGRFRYYQLSNEEVAKAIESIANVSGPLVSNSLNDFTKKKKLELALTKKFLELGWLREGNMKREIILTPYGKKALCEELNLWSTKVCKK